MENEHEQLTINLNLKRKAVEIYDSEEEQVAALKRWWKANGRSAIVGIGLGLAIMIAWSVWGKFQQDKTLQASSLYEQLLAAAEANKNDTVIKLSERLQDQYPSTAYADYAQMLLAKVKVEQGDLDAAKQILSNLVTHLNGELKHVATIRLIRLQLATGEYEQGLQTIAEIDSADANKFSANYEELKGDLYLALGRPAEARTAYQLALREGLASPLLQFKIDDLTTSEIVENVQSPISQTQTTDEQ
jgi:predicted negative regulator of RcsB-dependent stress response